MASRMHAPTPPVIWSMPATRYFVVLGIVLSMLLTLRIFLD